MRQKLYYIVLNEKSEVIKASRAINCQLFHLAKIRTCFILKTYKNTYMYIVYCNDVLLMLTYTIAIIGIIPYFAHGALNSLPLLSLFFFEYRGGGVFYFLFIAPDVRLKNAEPYPYLLLSLHGALALQGPNPFS